MDGRGAEWRAGIRVALMSSVQERRELSKFSNFETRVLDLGLYGRRGGYIGVAVV